MFRPIRLLRCRLLSRTFPSIGNSFRRNIDYENPPKLKFEELADETLESLHEYFDDLLEDCVHLPESDTMLNNGVLTINFNQTIGTYVINKQTPNTQLWLSSPTSGPKRYLLPVVPNYEPNVNAVEGIARYLVTG